MRLLFVAVYLVSVSSTDEPQQLAALSRQVAALGEQLQQLQQTQHSALRAAATRPPSSVQATDFGALGDGFHDDTAGLQAAIDRAKNGSLLLHFPNGKYRITSYLDWGQLGRLGCHRSDRRRAEQRWHLGGARPGIHHRRPYQWHRSRFHRLRVCLLRQFIFPFPVPISRFIYGINYSRSRYGYVEGIAFVGQCSGAMV